MRYLSYFNTAIKIIRLYDGAIPLQHFLKQYFSEHKKHGSSDRRAIANACYNFYRLGKSFAELSIEERLKLAIFICNNDITNWKILYNDEWINNHNDSLNQRIEFIKAISPSFNLHNVFPFLNELSETINADNFIQSFFIQPDVFIRIRPGFYNVVTSKLQQQNLHYKIMEENCISLPSSSKIDTVIKINKEAVIQDYSSQKVKEFLELTQLKTHNLKSPENIWDCCAGSGGKSILAYDVFKNISLTVTDIRSSILENLKRRFGFAGIKNYKAFVADLTNPKFQTFNSTFDLIIYDAPCTGSGTWSRTPEQLYFFQQEKINEYALRQQQIIRNAFQLLKNDGYFLYITCSVFKKENETVTDYIKQRFNPELIKMELLKGYNDKADSMFAALFRKV